MIFRSGMETLSHGFSVDSGSPPSKAYLTYPILIMRSLLLVQVLPNRAREQKRSRPRGQSESGDLEP